MLAGSSSAPRCMHRPKRWPANSPDLRRDRFYVWLSKVSLVPITVSGLLLFAGVGYWGGFGKRIAMVLGGVLLRVTLGLHARGW